MTLGKKVTSIHRTIARFSSDFHGFLSNVSGLVEGLITVGDFVESPKSIIFMREVGGTRVSGDTLTTTQGKPRFL